MSTQLRTLPSIERVLNDSQVEALSATYSRQAVSRIVKSHISQCRSNIQSGLPAPSFDRLVAEIVSMTKSEFATWPNYVINATGVILHTNLGRSPISREAAESTMVVAGGYSNLEINMATGQRGSRQAHISKMLCQLTGAEAAHVVNNNASAVLLGLTAITSQNEVIVSRGESVEIGGGFRIPDVLRQSNSILVEVGSTNRTYVHDFELAITEKTGAMLAVHTSNFKITGFAKSPTLNELIALGNKKSIPVLHDLGSGCLLDTKQFGLSHEIMPQSSIASGVALAFFSGDKLLGGPQSGIIVGKADYVDRIARHPLARAVRIDKLSLAALTTTLMHYVKGEATTHIPIWRMISFTENEIRSRASELQKQIGPEVSVHKGRSVIGGGSLPGETLPTWLLVIDGNTIKGGATYLSHALRTSKTPIMGRIDNDKILLDPRTILPEEESVFKETVKRTLDNVKTRKI